MGKQNYTLPSGPLAAALRAEVSRFNAAEDPGTVRAFGELVDTLEHEDIPGQALHVGQCAPDFTLPNAAGKPVCLRELLERGPVVLSWYRGGWCPYCNLQLTYLQTYLSRFQASGATLVALSPELPIKSIATGEKHRLQFDILTDKNNQVARKYGGVHRLNEGVRGYYGKMGVTDYYQDRDLNEFPVPATYIVDRERTVRYAYVNPDFRKRAEPEEMLEALKTISKI